MNELLPVLLLGVVAVSFAADSIGVSNPVGLRRTNATKLNACESGPQTTYGSAIEAQVTF